MPTLLSICPPPVDTHSAVDTPAHCWYTHPAVDTPVSCWYAHPLLIHLPLVDMPASCRHPHQYAHPVVDTPAPCWHPLCCRPTVDMSAHCWHTHLLLIHLPCCQYAHFLLIRLPPVDMPACCWYAHSVVDTTASCRYAHFLLIHLPLSIHLRLCRCCGPWCCRWRGREHGCHHAHIPQGGEGQGMQVDAKIASWWNLWMVGWSDGTFPTVLSHRWQGYLKSQYIELVTTFLILNQKLSFWGH